MGVKKLLSDWVLIELEPPRDTTPAGVILVGPRPIRTARVLRTGPGRRWGKRLVPIEVKPGDRIPFLKAATETKQGLQLAKKLPEGQEFIRETDILFVINEGEDVEITL